jgi:hypothetical protein
VVNSKVVNGNNKLEVATLKTGIYFVKVTDVKGSVIYTDKLIKE